MARNPPDPQGASPVQPGLETTAELLARARVGDPRALRRLFERVLPPLRRLAHHRIPHAIRDLTDTDDLVQKTLERAFRHLGEFEPRGEGAFFAYLRKSLLHRIADEIRRVRRRPKVGPLSDGLPDANRTPLELAIGRDVVDAYEAALASLPEDQRHAVILRVEFGYTHQEVADLLGRPTWTAARMLSARGLKSIAGRMRGRS